MDEPKARIGRGQLERLIVQLGKQGCGRLDLLPVLEEKRFVAGELVVAGNKEEREAELRGFWSAHIDHSLAIGEIREVVVKDVMREAESTALQIRVKGHREGVLEAVVLRPVVVAIHCAVLGVDTTGTYHLFLDEGIADHIGPALIGQRYGCQVMGLVLPVFCELKQSQVERLGIRILTAARVGRITVPEFNLDDLTVLNVRGAVRAVPGLYVGSGSCLLTHAS